MEEFERSNESFESKANASANFGNAAIEWFTKIVTTLKEYGYKHILGTMIVIFVGFLMVEVGIAIHKHDFFELIVEEHKREVAAAKEAHEVASEIRLKNSAVIRNILGKMLYQINADRVSLLEFHNGKENGTGLPFLYCDMTIEETKGRDQIINEYQNINLGNFAIADYLYEHKIFMGTVDELMEIDRKIAYKLQANDSYYLAVVMLKTNIEIGFLTITFKEEPQISHTELHEILTEHVQEIDYLLDYTKNINL